MDLLDGIIILVIMPVVLLILDVHEKPHKVFRLLPGIAEDSFSGFLVGDHKHGFFSLNFFLNTFRRSMDSLQAETIEQHLKSHRDTFVEVVKTTVKIISI